MTTCTGPDCNRAATTKTLCPGHYAQYRRGNPLKPLRIPGPRVDCTGPGCTRDASSMSKLCRAHLAQLSEGRPLTPIVARASSSTPRKSYGGKPRIATPGDPCHYPDCHNFTRSPTTGLCRAHLEQIRRGIDLKPLVARTPATTRADDGLPKGWFDTTVTKPRNPGNGSGGHISHDTIGAPVAVSDDMRLNAALVAVTHGTTVAERRRLLEMLGLDNLNTNMKETAA